MLTYSASCSKIQKRGAKSRLYVHVKDESILENLQNRRSRPVAVYKQLLAPIFASLRVKARWSQKAGCSCGCSPGFILDRTVHVVNDWQGNDLHVTIAGDVPKNDGTFRQI